ncbi:MAG: flagellar basal body rod protein FlgB [Acetobacteraceae bacterium]
MDLTSTGFFTLAERRLAWIDRNLEVRAENIANADTPGYQRQEVEPFSAVLAGTGALRPAATSTDDLPPLPASDQIEMPSIDPGEQSDGAPGAVSADTQLGKLADAEGMQNLVIRLYGATLGMFRTALDVSGGSGIGG